MRLDLKDRKILFELDKNSRQSYQAIAKSVGLSKDAVRYRINNYISDGIIKSFNAVIDVGKLGFISFRVFFKFYKLSLAKEKEIIDFLLKNKNLLWLVQVRGRWDMNTWFAYKSIKEMDIFYQQVLSRYGEYIDRKEFGIYTNVTYYGRTYLVNNTNKSAIKFISLPSEITLSKQDYQIIKLLTNNARESILAIAENTSLTSKTVILRIKKLERAGIIIGYRTEFDMSKLGYKYFKIHIITFNTSEERLIALRRYITQDPNILYNDMILGGYDVEFEIQIENEDKLQETLKDIRTKFADIIREYEILDYYKEYRLRFYPVL